MNALPPPREEQVERLMLAALQAMSPIADESTAEEVLNAMLNLAGRAVEIVIRTKGNADPVREYLQIQILKLDPVTIQH